jgi:hypothetical protein
MLARTIFAVLLGVVWTIYTAFVGAMFLGEPTLVYALASPVFYVVAILLLNFLPWICGLMSGFSGWVLAFLVLTGVYVVAFSTFGVEAPWFKVIPFCGAYVLFAMVAFRAMGGFKE